MANSFRYRWGETRPKSAPLKSGVGIFIGDMSFIDSSDSYKIKPAGSFTWVSAQSAPAAPTVTDTAVAIGSALTNAALGVKATYVTDYGETEASSAGSATPTAAAALRVTAITLPSGMRGIRYYVETSAGSGTYKFYRETMGESFLITGYGAAGGAAAPSVTTLGATVMTQAAFAALFGGVSDQYYDGTNLTDGIRDSKIRFDPSGVFEFDTASASYNVGDLVGPAKASGNTLEPQKVAAVANEYLACGRVVEATSSQTTVLVEIMTKLFAILK